MPLHCDYWRFNRTIPNLSLPQNDVRWSRIETAKRRALYDFDMLGLKYGSEADGVVPPLRFDFKAEGCINAGRSRDIVGGGDQVFTGHDNGLITINLNEADPIARETSRVQFSEAHRTLVGLSPIIST